MALIKTSMAISAISGKVGGAIYGNSAGGAWVRAWSRNKSALTDKRSDQNYFIQRSVNHWKHLSIQSKTVWKNNALLYPQVNRLGETFYLTGYQFFMKLSLQLRSIGQVQWGDEQLQELLIDLDYSKELFYGDRIKCLFTAETIPHDQVVVLYACPPMSGGRVRSPKSSFRMVSVIDTLQESFYDFTDDYMAAFGTTTFNAGQVLFTYIKHVSTLSGLASGRTYKKAIKV